MRVPRGNYNYPVRVVFYTGGGVTVNTNVVFWAKCHLFDFLFFSRRFVGSNNIALVSWSVFVQCRQREGGGGVCYRCFQASCDLEMYQHVQPCCARNEVHVIYEYTRIAIKNVPFLRCTISRYTKKRCTLLRYTKIGYIFGKWCNGWFCVSFSKGKLNRRSLRLMFND